MLQGEEPQAPTAKTDSPDAETSKTKEEAQQEKTKHNYARSIANTLTSCDEFIAHVTLMAGYAVNRELYEPVNLKLMRTQGYTLVEGVTTSEAKWRYAVAYRKDIFDAFEIKLSRIRAELILSGASDITVAQVQSIIRKLRGERAVAKDPKKPDSDYNSASQTNFDDVVANFARLIAMLAGDDDYNPVIDDLKLLALESELESMGTANMDVITSKAEWQAAITARNNFFNADVTGLVDVFMTSKKVVLANYGFKSLEYKRVKGLYFMKIR
ncbi:hypothetical protein M0G43_01260 [Subsaxibacter sp. CAU 1640]|uniref:hypothetical protein n=1 Tax=Subsaxibacter sp. CAU 1640 TaxID=2933271 RepID=UPI002002B93B|nr:hypothetical protein [Subsaxibacter sp. CAU 1640]MCK7589192.1 hypothetical protein [Subsaxibacter sp. CAU 1640]